MNDLKFAFRQLRKNPGFTTVVVVTVALGIGANTAIFSLLDQVMLRPLPVRNAEELLIVPGHFSYPRFERFRDQNGIFTEMFGTHLLANVMVNFDDGAISHATGQLVSGTYFTTLGVEMALGRPLRPDDDLAPESSPVAVISHAFWKRAFGGTSDVLGKTIQVRSQPGYANTSGLDIYDGAAARSADGAVLTIVGVAPPEFFGEAVGTATDLWIPMMMEPGVMPGRPWLTKDNVSWVSIMGHRKPGLNAEQASAAMTVVWRQILTEEAGANVSPERMRSIAQTVLKLEPGGRGFDPLRRQFSQPLLILMAVVGLVLLIACLNVATLLLARGAARQREMGIRLALGAGRVRLFRQLLTESLLLGLLGGVLGTFLAWVGGKVLLNLVSSGYEPIHLRLPPDWRTLEFTAVISLLTTTLFGLAPALRATRTHIAETLKNATRHSGNRPKGSAGRFLVAIQVGVSMVLLVGAGLFLRSFHNLNTQDVGYDPNHLLMLRLDPVSAGYRGESIGQVCRNLLERIVTLPGVRAATFSENGLFFGPESQTKLDVEGFIPRSEEDQRCRFDQVGPGYFTIVGIPLRIGRDMTDRDGPNAPRVAVINETMARFYFPNSNPVGKHLTTRLEGRSFTLEIVGVAHDAQDHNFWSERVRRFYVSYFQPIDGITEANFAIRTASHPNALIPVLRQAVQAQDRNLMIQWTRDVKSLMHQSLVQERLITGLSTVFAVLAILLAALGLYGVVAYEVTRRTSEIGIRMALGAQRAAVLKMIITNGMRLTLLGMALGLGSAFALTRLIANQLHQIKPLDPLTFAVAAASLLLITLLASWLPAHRATRVNPMEALRWE